MTLTIGLDDPLIGREIAFGTTRLGDVEGVLRDPLTHRVRRLITTYAAGYGAGARRVAVPMEWVVRASAVRVEIGVGVRSLDELPDYRGVPTWPPAELGAGGDAGEPRGAVRPGWARPGVAGVAPPGSR